MENKRIIEELEARVEALEARAAVLSKRAGIVESEGVQEGCVCKPGFGHCECK